MERPSLNLLSTTLTVQGSIKSSPDKHRKGSLNPQDSVNFMSFGFVQQESLQHSAGREFIGSNPSHAYDHMNFEGQLKNKGLQFQTGRATLEKVWFTSSDHNPRNISFGRQASSNSFAPNAECSQDAGFSCEAPDSSLSHNITIMAAKISKTPRLKLSLSQNQASQGSEISLPGKEDGLSEKFAKYLEPPRPNNRLRLQPISMQPAVVQQEIHQQSPVLLESPKTRFNFEYLDQTSPPQPISQSERAESHQLASFKKLDNSAFGRLPNRSSLRFVGCPEVSDAVPSWAAQSQDLARSVYTSSRRFSANRGCLPSRKSLVSGGALMEVGSAFDSQKMSAMSPPGRSAMGTSDYLIKLKASAVTLELLVDRVPDFQIGGATTPASQIDIDLPSQLIPGRPLITDTLTGQRYEMQNNSWCRFSPQEQQLTNTIQDVRAQAASRPALDTNPDLEALLGPFLLAALERTQKAGT